MLQQIANYRRNTVTDRRFIPDSRQISCFENHHQREFYAQMYPIERGDTLTLHADTDNTVHTDAYRMGPGKE